MKLIVGLGNIGKEFSRTRHNVGFMVVDALAEKLGKKFNKSGCDADFLETNIGGEKVILAKPRTYMNESGKSVKSFVKKFNISLFDVLVICDDIDLPQGKIRLRQSGSAGTHNGLKSIIFELSSDGFNRLRVGMGKQSEHEDLADYVLSNIPQTGAQKLGIERAIDAASMFAQGENMSQIMTKFNGEN